MIKEKREVEIPMEALKTKIITSGGTARKTGCSRQNYSAVQPASDHEPD